MAELTPEQMVSPKAIAPYEAALAFKLWHEMMQVDILDQGFVEYHVCNIDIDTHDACEGLGAPWPHRGERPADFGERCAVALFTLIKEI